LKKIETTREASFLISKFVISCHDIKGRQLIRKGVKKEKLLFVDFKQAGKITLFNLLARTARSLGKNVIDEEVVLKYFGGRKHEQKTLRDIKKENLQKMRDYFMLIHLMILAKVIEVVGEKIICQHKSGGYSVLLEATAPFGEKVLPGQMVLCHNSVVVATKPSRRIMGYLSSDQKECRRFMKSLKKFDGKTVKMLSSSAKAVKKIVKKYVL